MALTQPIRKPEQVRALLSHFKNKGEHRNSVLLHLGIFTALRISDILSLKTEQVYDFKNRIVRDSIALTEQKTGKKKSVALNDEVKKALKLYFPCATQGRPLLLNAKTGKSISRNHAYRIVVSAAKAANIPHNVSCHSLRKTFGYHAWHNGTSPVVLTEIYNHSSYAVTKRYLGVTQDDKDAVYLGLSFSAPSCKPPHHPVVSLQKHP